MNADETTLISTKYTHTIADESLGIYTVTRTADGQTWTWRCRGEDQIKGQVNKALHIHKFPPDDGSREWLEAVAQDACEMFYTIEANEREREVEDAAQPSAAQRYLLNTTGTTYHSLACDKATSGSLKTLADIAAYKPDARPCAVCNPPSLVEVAALE